MGWLIVLSLISNLILLWYIRRLRNEIDSYQTTLVKIEEIADANTNLDK